jgi:hypothetical protein
LLTKAIVPLNPKAQRFKTYKDERINIVFELDIPRDHKFYADYARVQYPLLQTKKVTAFFSVYFLETPTKIGVARNPVYADLRRPQGCITGAAAPVKGERFDHLYVIGTTGIGDGRDPSRFCVIKKLHCLQGEEDWRMFDYIIPEKCMLPTEITLLDRKKCNADERLKLEIMYNNDFTNEQVQQLKLIEKGDKNRKNPFTKYLLISLCKWRDLPSDGNRATLAKRLVEYHQTERLRAVYNYRLPDGTVIQEQLWFTHPPPEVI